MKMKIKALAIALALSVMLLGCGTAAAATAENDATPAFSMEFVDKYSDFDIYQDMETGVQYIVYKEYSHGGYSWFGMVPRYNADGSLYVGG